jgi:hypothetical protein
VGKEQLWIVYEQGRIASIARLPNAKPALFEYTSEGLLEAVTLGNRSHQYTWAKTRQPLPPIIGWIKPYYLQSADRRRFNFVAINNIISMSSLSEDEKRKEMILRVRYGSIISIQEKRN